MRLSAETLEMRGRLFSRALALSLLAWVTGAVSQAAPGISFTHVPAFGTTENLTGLVTNANPSAQRVAVFIYVPSAGWYSKPSCAASLTKINANGSWTADITTGGSDPLATQITVLLVSTNYGEPCVSGLEKLPDSVLTQALASATVVRHDPAVRRIRFSGYDWWVKSGSGLLGPGPNYFADSTNNVWVDTQGELHLKITNHSNRWECAEIVSDRSFGFGSYRFELKSEVNALDPNAVLGLFTWSDNPAYAHREIDVECSRWSNSADTNDSQFVVQPFDSSGHLVRYRVPPGSGTTTHTFNWDSNRISFSAQKGLYSPAPPTTNLIRSWGYTLSVPQPGDENVRLNLWLYQGKPPAVGQEVEFIIRSFRFVAPGAAQPATLTNSYVAPPEFRFEVQGQQDRFYAVQTSTNLQDWATVTTLLSTNSLMSFSAPAVLAGDAAAFYRCVTLP
jgi:hypothetical protein